MIMYAQMQQPEKPNQILVLLCARYHISLYLAQKREWVLVRMRVARKQLLALA